MKRYRLKHWSFIRRFSKSRGGLQECLTGEVYDNPSYPDGTRIVTSCLASHDEHQAVTSSGTRYLLEDEPAGEGARENANDLTRGIE